MKQSLKKLFCMFTAAALTAGALSLTACGGSSFRPVSPDQAEHVESNGGFVVSTDEYYYFINGVESNQSDNTYGEVVKGALMRIKKSDVAAKKNEAETVIPSLMVTGDPATAAGICIYGGRIYYATPNNIKNTDGGINRDRLNFRSVKTDGSDVKDIFALDNGSVEYRFVEIDGTVYVLYIDGTTIHSYNTKNGTDTVLAENAGNPTFHNTDKEDPYVYYTMSVTDGLDRESGQISYSYNQIYRVRADVTEETAGHTYTWDEDYLKEHDDKAPYVNLGEIVLDGIGAIDQKVAITQFNHDVTEENVSQLPRIGYTYTMQEYSNEGIYFVRKLYRNDSSLGTSGELYYLPISAIGKGKSIANNAAKPASDGVLDVVASATNTSNASSSAMFYLENGQHKYLYVSDGYIYRVDVKTDGSGAPEDTVEIAYGAANATFVLRDDTSSQEYKYLYYSVTNGNGRSVHRAVYNGEKRDYGNLQFGDEDQALWSAVKLLDVQHASSWYDYEILGGTLFYANSESFGSNTYNYIYTVDLTNPNGTLMNNAEIKAFNEKYEEVTDTEDGYFGEVKKNVSENAATALRYYFYTGSKTQFEENIKYSVDTCGHKEEYLYTVKEKDAFNAFAAGTVKDSDGNTRFLDQDRKDANGNPVSYRTLSYFTAEIGKHSEADDETLEEYWRTTLRYDELKETEEEGLAWWAWTLIGVGIGVVAAAAAVTAVLLVRKKKAAQNGDKPEKMRVDTTDDKSVDVYATGSEDSADAAVTEAVTEEPAAETAEPEESAIEEAVQEQESAAEEPAAETAEPEGSAIEEAVQEQESATEEPAAEKPVEETAAETENKEE